MTLLETEFALITDLISRPTWISASRPKRTAVVLVGDQPFMEWPRNKAIYIQEISCCHSKEVLICHFHHLKAERIPIHAANA